MNPSSPILFIHTAFSSFVRSDYETLNKNFSVKRFQYQQSKRLIGHVQSQLELLFFLLKNVWDAKIIYVFFADYHSFLPILFAKIFGKKTILALGGYDVTYIPELKYGSFSNPLRSFCTKFSIGNAGFLAPVDESLIVEARNRVNRIRGQVQVIPTGYDSKRWYCDTEKEPIVLTVGPYPTLQRVKLKGIDFLLEVAQILKQYHFVVVGMNEHVERLLNVPDNVQFVEKLSREELRKYYSRAKVYAQFSLREGLPNAVCEAMMCECVPIGSDKNGIPTAIGNCGFILKKRDVHLAAQLVEQAMKAPPALGKKARQRILENFTPLHREIALLSLIDSKPQDHN